MTSATQDLAALLGSRICHDLISPLGAISNGVELLEMSGVSAGPEMDLISESIDNANARIRYFRVAFGAASPGQMIGAGEIKGILEDLNRGHRLNIDWAVSGELSRQDVKLVFLLLQCFETAMPWGGQINVSASPQGWLVQGTSERMKINATLWEALSRPQTEADISAAEVQFMLLPLLLKTAGRQLTVEMGDTNIRAQF